MLKPNSQAFWNEFLASLATPADATGRFYEVFAIGSTRESADEGAALILSGVKTATSSLVWDYVAKNKPMPDVGSLSIVADGGGTPVCIVETTALEIKPLRDVDAQFAYDYGEGDRTLEGWRADNLAYNRPRCLALGKSATDEMPLLCERFVVVYP